MAYRFKVFSGPPSGSVSGLSDFPVTSPSAGGNVDTVRDTTGGGNWNVWTGRGTPLKVEAGGSISSGDDLETDGSGRAVTASGGTVVARALESASSGQEFWAVWV